MECSVYDALQAWMTATKIKRISLRNLTKIDFELEALKTILERTNYQRYPDFRRKVIEPAILVII